MLDARIIGPRGLYCGKGEDPLILARPQQEVRPVLRHALAAVQGELEQPGRVEPRPELVELLRAEAPRGAGARDFEDALCEASFLALRSCPSIARALDDAGDGLIAALFSRICIRRGDGLGDGLQVFLLREPRSIRGIVKDYGAFGDFS